MGTAWVAITGVLRAPPIWVMVCRFTSASATM
jgi:hypothetical protein